MVQQVSQFFEDFGYIGLFIHSFIDAVIFPIPAFFTQVSLSMLDPQSAIWFATVGYIACLLGTPIGYFIGKKLGEPVLHKFLKPKWVEKATNSFNKNGEVAILIGAFTPIPFKVFTILSGCFHYSVWKLLAFAAIGRAVKFYVVGVAFYLFGRASEEFVMEYLTYFMAGIAVILLGIFYIKRKLTKKKKQFLERQENYVG
jgi:membrane protein YqaA with SNARE-associated domain